MVFSGEGVPLRENILKKDIEFVKNWLEWSAENRTQIIRSGNADTVIFTVPQKTTLWITNVYLFLIHTTANTVSQGIGLQTSSTFIIRGLNGLGLGGTENTVDFSLSFRMPLKVEEGDIIFTNPYPEGKMSAGFMGFLVPKKIS